MTRHPWRSVAATAIVALPLAALFWIVLEYRSFAPEPPIGREVWSELPFVHTDEALFEFAGRPRYLVMEALRSAGLRFGPDFDVLAFAPFVVVAATFVLLLLARQRLGLASKASLALVAGLLCSPVFATNWLVFERVRVYVPMLAIVAAVLCLAGDGRRGLRFVSALVFAAVAVASQRSGALAWLGLVPLVYARRGLRSVVLWILVLASWTSVVHHDPGTGKSALLARLVEAPLQSLDVVGQVMSAALPDWVPGRTFDETLLACLIVFGFVAAAALVLRRDAAFRQCALPPFSLAAAGAMAVVAVADERIGGAIFGNLLVEACPLGVFLPVFSLVTLALAYPTLTARLRVGAISIFALLLAQQWNVGIDRVRQVAVILRQGEAVVCFIDCEGVEVTGRPAVATRVEREGLRSRNKLGRLQPFESLSVAAFDARSSAEAALAREVGRVEGADGRGVRGSVAGADLVLLSRSGTGRFFRAVAPNLGVTPAAWFASFDGDVAFEVGEVVEAWSFDVRERNVQRLAAAVRWNGTGFDFVEAK